jgi:hypothetical protein
MPAHGGCPPTADVFLLVVPAYGGCFRHATAGVLLLAVLDAHSIVDILVLVLADNVDDAIVLVHVQLHAHSVTHNLVDFDIQHFAVDDADVVDVAVGVAEALGVPLALPPTLSELVGDAETVDERLCVVDALSEPDFSPRRGHADGAPGSPSSPSEGEGGCAVYPEEARATVLGGLLASERELGDRAPTAALLDPVVPQGGGMVQGLPPSTSFYFLVLCHLYEQVFAIIPRLP